MIKSRRMRWVVHVAHVGQLRNADNIVVEKPEGKWPRGRPRHRWEYNIRIDFKEIGCEGVDWIKLAK
jgi:hypothetical protein